MWFQILADLDKKYAELQEIQENVEYLPQV